MALTHVDTHNFLFKNNNKNSENHQQQQQQHLTNMLSSSSVSPPPPPSSSSSLSLITTNKKKLVNSHSLNTNSNMNSNNRSEQIRKLSNSALLSSIQLYDNTDNNINSDLFLSRSPPPPPPSYSSLSSQTVMERRRTLLNNSKSLNHLSLYNNNNDKSTKNPNCLIVENVLFSPSLLLSNAVESGLKLSANYSAKNAGGGSSEKSIEKVNQVMQNMLKSDASFPPVTLSYSSSSASSSSAASMMSNNHHNRTQLLSGGGGNSYLAISMTQNGIEDEYETVYDDETNKTEKTEDDHEQNSNNNKIAIKSPKDTKKNTNTNRRRFGFAWVGRNSKR
jgi:hypothetical protein